MPGFLDTTLREIARRLAPVGTARHRFACRVVDLLRHGLDIPIGGVPLELLDSVDAADAVLYWFDHDLLARSRFPLALLPGRSRRCAAWLQRRRPMRLTAERSAAAERQFAADPARWLAALYRRHPEWQAAVPEGLSRPTELRTWLRRRYRYDPAWLTDGADLKADVRQLRGVNILAHFRYPSGVQAAAWNAVRALRQTGWDVSCRDVPTGADLPLRDGLLGMHPYDVTIAHLQPEPLGKTAYPLAGLLPRPGVHRVGVWYWELEQVPSTWRRHADWLDEVWAPTPFIAGALRSAVPMPVIDMLPGIPLPPQESSSKESPTERPSRSQWNLPEDRYLFLFAFDMNSTMERKNPLGLIAAFRQAFRPDEPVGLVVKVSRGSVDPKSLAALRQACEPGRILLIDAVLDDLQGLMSACDAYVSLHRSEGFGLTMAEAMALGKPTIATGYSGNLAFMTDRNSRLVDFDLIAVTEAGPYRKGRWAAPSVEHAARWMRSFVDDKAAARELGERGQASVRAQLSLEAAGRRMTARLEAIAAERKS